MKCYKIVSIIRAVVHSTQRKKSRVEYRSFMTFGELPHHHFRIRRIVPGLLIIVQAVLQNLYRVFNIAVRFCLFISVCASRKAETSPPAAGASRPFSFSPIHCVQLAGQHSPANTRAGQLRKCAMAIMAESCDITLLPSFTSKSSCSEHHRFHRNSLYLDEPCKTMIPLDAASTISGGPLKIRSSKVF